MMKKLFSLFCAIAIALCASAAPVAQKAQVANLNQLSATPAVKVNNPKATVVKSQKAMKAENQLVRRVATSAKTVAKAPQNTAITIGTFSPATYEGEYYVILTDANSTTQFIFDIDISANPFELGKTYTIADMVEGYTGIGDAEDWYTWTSVTDASYTETKDQDGLTHVVASMTDEDGNVYDITYDQLPSQSKTIVASDFSMTDYGTDMFFILTDSVGNQFRFDVLYTGSFEFDKTYTLADMDPDYSWYKLATGGGLTYIEASFTITEDKDELLHVVAAVVLNNGDSYEITYDEKAFVPTGVQITVDGTDLNGRYMSAYGFYLYTATWGDYTVQLAFDAEEEKAAYTNEEFIANYGSIYSDDEDIQLFKLASDNITITTTETTKTLAGSVYAKNGDEYVLNLVYEKPEPKSVVDIDNAEFYVYEGFMEQYGLVNFYGGNEDYDFDLYAYADTIVGDFADAVDFVNSYIESADGKISILDVYSFNVAGEGKALTLTVSFLGSDTIQYNISATGYYGYIQGDAVEGYVGEFTVKEVAIQQVAISEVNYIHIAGTNAAGDQLALVVKGELADGAIAAGTYTEVMACPGFDAQGQLNPSYVGNNAGVWFIQSGKLTINADGSMKFEGLNSYDKDVTINFIVSTPTALPTLFDDGVKANKFLHNGQLIIRKGNKHFDALGAEVK